MRTLILIIAALLAACGGGGDDVTELHDTGAAPARCPADRTTFVGPIPADCFNR